MKYNVGLDEVSDTDGNIILSYTVLRYNIPNNAQ